MAEGEMARGGGPGCGARTLSFVSGSVAKAMPARASRPAYKQQERERAGGPRQHGVEEGEGHVSTGRRKGRAKSARGGGRGGPRQQKVTWNEGAQT